MPKITVTFLAGQDGVRRLVPDPECYRAQQNTLAEDLESINELLAALAAKEKISPLEERELQQLTARKTQSQVAQATLARYVEKLRRIHADPRLQRVEYTFHPYTANERIAAREEATSFVNGELRFKEDVWEREIVDACIEEPEIAAGSEPGPLVAYLAGRIAAACEVSLEEIAFFPQ